MIFCAKDIPARQIIDWMTSINKPNVEYKIVPDESNFIIGSSSKNAQGDYYTFDIQFNINKKENRRKKRFLDVSLSLITILLFPLLIFTKRKFNNLIDSFSVLFGKKTWVATNDTENSFGLKKGIFTPSSNNKKVDEKTAHRLNMLYAKNYTPNLDFEIVFSQF